MEYNMHYKKMLDELRGKTIGLVYFFEKEDALGAPTIGFGKVTLFLVG